MIIIPPVFTIMPVQTRQNINCGSSKIYIMLPLS